MNILSVFPDIHALYRDVGDSVKKFLDSDLDGDDFFKFSKFFVVHSIDVKNVQKRIKNVKKRKKRNENKKRL